MVKPEGAVKDMLDNFTEEYGGTDTAENKTSRNSIEIGVKVQPEDEATAQLLEGVLCTDSYPHIGKDDVLVLRCQQKLSPREREALEESIADKVGIKVALIDGNFDIVGVVEHGA